MGVWFDALQTDVVFTGLLTEGIHGQKREASFTQCRMSNGSYEC
jgi:hypothetical protein